MLTSADLDRIPLDENVLKFIPEVIARRHSVLPLRSDENSLHVVLPSDADGTLGESIEAIEVALKRKLSYDLADHDLLTKLVDLHYSERGSVVQNCPRNFVFRCSKRWVDLDRTGNDRVRHCNSCDTNVRLCKVDGELEEAMARGECVAYYDSSEAFLGIICDNE